MIDRSADTFIRWAHALRPAIERVTSTSTPWDPTSAWAQAQRNIAARVALAMAREQRIDAHLATSAVVIDRVGALPLRRRGDFDLHQPDLTAPRPALLGDPVALWHAFASRLRLPVATRLRVARELSDSVFNLALAQLAARARPSWAAHAPEDARVVDPEHWVTEGHPWHPMTKTRMGLGLREHAMVAPELGATTPVHALDVRRALVQVTPEFIERLQPWLGTPAADWVRLPIHGLAGRRLAQRFAERWGTDLRPAPWQATGRSLLSLRTVAMHSAATGPLHFKLALDVHTTSARRIVSPMSVANGPRVTALLRSIGDADPICARLSVVPEVMTAGLRPEVVGPHARELGIIVRDGRAFEDERGRGGWVCASLGDPAPLDGIPGVQRLAQGYRGTAIERATAMVTDYINALIPPVLRFATVHGIALEVHLQNTLVIPRDGRPHRFVVRDLGGIRLHEPRMRAAGHHIELHPDSFLRTQDVTELQTKLSHTLLHAHLTALFGWVEDELGLARPHAWALAHRCITRHLDAWANDPRLRPACESDRDALLAPTVRAKALFQMRIDDRSSDYAYVSVANPLATAGAPNR